MQALLFGTERLKRIWIESPFGVLAVQTSATHVLSYNGKAVSQDRKQKFDSAEAKKRFEAALRGAREAGHKPMKSLTQKRPKKQRINEKEPR
jgi:hypothetical protein